MAPPTSPKGAESPSESELIQGRHPRARWADTTPAAAISCIGRRSHSRSGMFFDEIDVNGWMMIFDLCTQSKIEELNVNVQHLQDQNTLLKAQRNNNVIIDEGDTSTPPSESSTDKLVKELEALRLDNEILRGQLEQQQQAANHFVGIPPAVSIFMRMRN